METGKKRWRCACKLFRRVVAVRLLSIRYIAAVTQYAENKRAWKLARRMVHYTALSSGQEPSDNHPAAERLVQRREQLIADGKLVYALRLRILGLHYQILVLHFALKGYRLVI